MVALAWVAACSLEGLSDGVRPPSTTLPESGPPDAGAVGDDDASSEAAAALPSCPGATCEVLRTDEPKPTEIAFVGDRLYWLRASLTGDVMSSDRNGQNLLRAEGFPIASPHDLAVVAIGDAYAVSADNVMARYVDYSTCTSGPGIQRMVAMGNSLLFAKSDGLYRGGCGDLDKLATESSLSAIDGDPPFAYYARKSGEIVRCDISANNTCESSRVVLARDQGNQLTTVTHDDTRVYWITGSEIRMRDKSASAVGAAPEVLATGILPRTLATSSSGIYFTDIEAGTVSRVDVASRAITVLAAGLSRPWGITLDSGTSLFVTEEGAGRLVRIRR